MSRFAAVVALILALPVLAQQDPADGLELILQALDDDDYEVRNAAQADLAAWCERVGECAVPLLMARTRSSGPEIRARVEVQVALLARVEEARQFVSVFSALAPTDVAGLELVVFNTGARRPSRTSEFECVLGWRLSQSDGRITLLEDSLRVRTYSLTPPLPADWAATRAAHPADEPLPGEARPLDFGALCGEVLDSQDLNYPRPPRRVAPRVLRDGAEVALYAYWAFQHKRYCVGASLVELARRLLSHVRPSCLARTSEKDLVDSVGNSLCASATRGAFEGVPAPELLEQWRLIARMPEGHWRGTADRYLRGYEGLLAEDRDWKEPDAAAIERMDPVERAEYWVYRLREVRTCNAFAGDHARVFFDAACGERSLPFPPGELVRIGWQALPVLISRLEDSRPSRCLGGTGRIGGSCGSLITLGQVCDQVIEKIIGEPLLRGPGHQYWMDRPAVRRAAEAWWREHDHDVRRLIYDLGNVEFSVRDSAQRMLIAVGERDESGHVYALMEAALGSTDPEVVARSIVVLEAIRAWERYMVLQDSGRGRVVDVLTGGVCWNREMVQDPSRRVVNWHRERSPYLPNLVVWPRGPGARVYVADADGLECLELRTGRTRWRVPSRWGDGGIAGDSWIGIRAGAVQEPPVATRVSLVDGATLWSVPIEGLGRELPLVEPLVESGRVCIFAEGAWLALDFATGATLWKGELPGVWSLNSVGGALYAQSSLPGRRRAVSRIDPTTGAEVWRSELPPDRQSFVVADGGEAAGIVLLRGWGANGPRRTIALDESTGEERWSVTHSMGRVLPQPGGETAWVPVSRGFSLVSVATGEVLARHTTRTETVSMTQDGDRILVVDFGSHGLPLEVVALRASDGKELTTLVVPSELLRPRSGSFGFRGGVPLEKRLGGWILPCYESSNGCLLRFDERIERLTDIHVLHSPRLTR